MSDESEAVNRDLGIGKEYDFIGCKKVVKPLGVESIGDVLTILKKLNDWKTKKNTKTFSGEEIFSLIAEDEDIKNAVSRMVAKTVETQILPDASQDEQANFVTKNLIYLTNAVIEQNMPSLRKEDAEKLQKLEEFRKIHNESANKNKSKQ